MAEGRRSGTQEFASRETSAMLGRFASEVTELLGLPPLPRTFAAAMRDLESKRPEIRRSALVDLVRYADSVERSRIESALARLLRHDADSEVRALAAIAIADANLGALVPTLLVALEDRVPRVRQMALLALGEVGQNGELDGLEQIRRLLKSELPALRYQALVAISSLAGANAMPELLAALDDGDEEVCWIAWMLLERRLEGMLQQRPSAAATPSSESKAQATTFDSASFAARWKEQPLSASMRIRVISAAVLYRLGEPSALAGLLERVQRHVGMRRDELVELAQQFGRLKYEPARDWLKTRARRGWLEGALGWPALVALGALGDVWAQTEILDELDATSVRRKVRAIVAIGELKLVAASSKIQMLGAESSGISPTLIEQTLAALGSPIRTR